MTSLNWDCGEKKWRSKMIAMIHRNEYDFFLSAVRMNNELYSMDDNLEQWPIQLDSHDLSESNCRKSYILFSFEWNLNRAFFGSPLTTYVNSGHSKIGFRERTYEYVWITTLLNIIKANINEIEILLVSYAGCYFKQ